MDDRLDEAPAGDGFAALAAEVNAMLDRLAGAFRSQERFISEVSHELKTPVAALLTEAQVLKYSRPDVGAYGEFILSVEDEMRRLGKLVESFLMLARFGHGRRYVAETLVAINDAALDSVQHSALLASQHSVALHLDLYDPAPEEPDALVRGDAELLRAVIDNLIRNAVQFSASGKSVYVTVRRDGADVVAAVRDEGPGVPPEYLERIFDRFAQAPGSKSERRGSGLGLAIAKGVVDLHGGTISATNWPGGGCVFTVRLPLAEAAAPGGASLAAGPSGAADAQAPAGSGVPAASPRP